jgi:hypothetical protein
MTSYDMKGRKTMMKMLPMVMIWILVFSGLGAGALSFDKVKKIAYANEDTYDMVIIAPKIFVSNLQPLVDHKNDHGVKTFVKTTEDIISQYNGRDDAEKVKYFIKNAIETNNITYVLLVGGHIGQFSGWYVPVRYANLDDGTNYSFFLSDLYFADIYKGNTTEFEDWDSNGNGIFAEWNANGKDVLDLTPDVIVGRLPCRNRFEVKAIVQKIITYETTSAGEWFNRMVCIGGDTFLGVGDPFPYEGEVTCDVAASYMNGFDIVKLYTSTGALTGPDDVLRELNQGCGFVLTRGRGGTDKMRTFLPDGTEIVPIQNKFVRRLTNTGEYPVVILGECNHGKFDVRILNIFKILKGDLDFFYNFTHNDCVPECIAWQFVKQADSGAIATITNTNFCYGDVGDKNHNGIPDDAERYGGYLATGFFKQYGQNGERILGKIFYNTLSDYIKNFPCMSYKVDCKSVQEWTLFGDPSLMIGGIQ